MFVAEKMIKMKKTVKVRFTRPLSVLTMDKPTFLTSREAAERLGVSLRTVQLWVEDGVLQAWKTAGGHRRIARGSVDRLVGEQQAAMNAAGGGAALKVLVVEDEAALLDLYRAHFSAWELPVALRTASNGFDALMQIGAESPDVLIMDLNMPGVDGYQLVAELKRQQTMSGMQIIVVTGLAIDEVRASGRLPKSVQVFGKPIPFAGLHDVLRDGFNALHG